MMKVAHHADDGKNSALSSRQTSALMVKQDGSNGQAEFGRLSSWPLQNISNENKVFVEIVVNPHSKDKVSEKDIPVKRNLTEAFNGTFLDCFSFGTNHADNKNTNSTENVMDIVIDQNSSSGPNEQKHSKMHHNLGPSNVTSDKPENHCPTFHSMLPFVNNVVTVQVSGSPGIAGSPISADGFVQKPIASSTPLLNRNSGTQSGNEGISPSGSEQVREQSSVLSNRHGCNTKGNIFPANISSTIGQNCVLLSRYSNSGKETVSPANTRMAIGRNCLLLNRNSSSRKGSVSPANTRSTIGQKCVLLSGHDSSGKETVSPANTRSTIGQSCVLLNGHSVGSSGKEVVSFANSTLLSGQSCDTVVGSSGGSGNQMQDSGLGASFRDSGPGAFFLDSGLRVSLSNSILTSSRDSGLGASLRNPGLNASLRSVESDCAPGPSLSSGCLTAVSPLLTTDLATQDSNSYSLGSWEDSNSTQHSQDADDEGDMNTSLTGMKWLSNSNYSIFEDRKLTEDKYVEPSLTHQRTDKAEPAGNQSQQSTKREPKAKHLCDPNQREAMNAWKPLQNYKELITSALLSRENHTMKVDDIRKWIISQHHFYKFHEKCAYWKLGIQHTLSNNSCFMRLKFRSGTSVWKLDLPDKSTIALQKTAPAPTIVKLTSQPLHLGASTVLGNSILQPATHPLLATPALLSAAIPHVDDSRTGQGGTSLRRIMPRPPVEQAVPVFQVAAGRASPTQRHVLINPSVTVVHLPPHTASAPFHNTSTNAPAAPKRSVRRKQRKTKPKAKSDLIHEAAVQSGIDAEEAKSEITKSGTFHNHFPEPKAVVGVETSTPDAKRRRTSPSSDDSTVEYNSLPSPIRSTADHKTCTQTLPLSQSEELLPAANPPHEDYHAGQNSCRHMTTISKDSATVTSATVSVTPPTSGCDTCPDLWFKNNISFGDEPVVCFEQNNTGQDGPSPRQDPSTCSSHFAETDSVFDPYNIFSNDALHILGEMLPDELICSTAAANKLQEAEAVDHL